MKINVTTVIRDLKGEPMKEGENDVTLRTLIDAAVNSTANAERLTTEEKAHLFQVGVKLWSSKEVDFTVDQLALIKKRGGEVFPSPVVYGRLCELIDNPPEIVETTEVPDKVL